MLDPTTLKQRIDAARTLRGLTQDELGDLLHGDGLGKHDVGRLERGKLDLQAVHRHALCRHLGVPDEWFTEPDLDRLLGILGPGEIRERLERIEAALADAGGIDYTRLGIEFTRRLRAMGTESANADPVPPPAGTSRDATDATPGSPEAPDEETPGSGSGAGG